MKISQIRRHKRKQALKSNTARLTLTSLIDIFTLLVCFLLVGFQGEAQIPSIKGLALPISSSYAPPESSLTLVVTPTEIRVNEKVIQRLDVPVAEGATMDFTPLITTLAQQALRFKPSQVVNGTPERTVIILADQNIPYATLHQIMMVCSQQHFGRIAFAVNKEAKKNA
ncbi:ExbD/TolR family protein [Aquirhabdus parva]|uniref:Biopolymer transporter ExbD n=1 Tax=Aquirhabdus parva TaxID=2283318 RepID=A0A345P488_9GAMM|nr:biopolymer transporter ExbD [Aquirhabdus parva]AXI02097.1 biopolymer transporter ExbD [Aquirhabdus parva]